MPTRLLAPLATLLLVLTACAPAAPAAKPGSSNAAPAAPAASSPARSPASGQPASTEASGQLQALVDAARQEGALTLVWSETAIGGTKTAQRLGEGFNRTYGLNLSIQFTPGPSMPEIATKLTQEYQNGRRASSDIMLGTELHVASVMEPGLLEPVDWLAWSPNIRDRALLAPDGIAVQIASTTPNITYNSSKLTGDQIPRTLQDLLKPQYKGRLASTPYAALFDYLASPEVWGEARTMEWTRGIADQASGLIRVGELQRLVSGEYDLLAINSNEYEPRKWQAEGAPIAFVIPADAPMLLFRFMGVPRNAAHPAAAKLWVSYLVSREAQDILYETAYTDHFRLPGSKTADAIKQLQASGVRFYEFDTEFIQRQDLKELNRILNEQLKILQKQ